LAPRTLRYLLAALVIPVLYFAFGACAEARPPLWRPSPPPPPYSFTVEDENGNALPTFRQGGRTFLLGEPGLRYNIRVRNPTAQRVEAVVSVDGRDAVSGDPGDYVSGRGYVIPPYGSVLVDGFRRSFAEVATFRFTSPEDSYSARMGTPQNVGVIGVAFFPERVRRPPPPPPIARRPMPRPVPYDSYDSPSYDGRGASNDKAAPAPTMQHPRAVPPRASAPASEGAGAGEARRDRAPAKRDSAQGAPSDDLGGSGSVNNLGTEFGETRESVVSSVSFERASPTHPALLTTLRYDDADGLSARGIDLSVLGYYYRRPPMNDEPQAFPVSHFAQPPP